MICTPYQIFLGRSKAGHVAQIGERRGAYRVLVGKPEGKDTSWKTNVLMGG